MAQRQTIYLIKVLLAMGCPDVTAWHLALNNASIASTNHNFPVLNLKGLFDLQIACVAMSSANTYSHCRVG